MKKIYLIILATVAFVQLSTAQNNVPATGPVSFGTTSTSNLLNIGSSTTRGTVSITGSTTAAPVLSLTDSHTGGRGYSLYSGLSALGSFEIFDQTASAYRFVINSSGNIGIGTITPLANLHVIDNFSPSSGGPASTTATPNGSFILGNNGTGLVATMGLNAWDPTPNFWIQPRNSTSINYYNTVLNPNGGSVGIGTTYIPAGYRFAINGSALATSVTVLLRTSWPDYVFKNDYQLPSLSDVKTYIDKNHHLPEIPSAATVEKDGINLGEMNKVLVKKVEELTLYLIDKDKQITDQQTKNAEQESKLNSLQQQLNQVKQQMEAITKQLNKNN